MCICGECKFGDPNIGGKCCGQNPCLRGKCSGIEVMYLIFFLILPVGVLFINYEYYLYTLSIRNSYFNHILVTKLIDKDVLGLVMANCRYNCIEGGEPTEENFRN